MFRIGHRVIFIPRLIFSGEDVSYSFKYKLLYWPLFSLTEKGIQVVAIQFHKYIILKLTRNKILHEARFKED